MPSVHRCKSGENKSSQVSEPPHLSSVSCSARRPLFQCVIISVLRRLALFGPDSLYFVGSATNLSGCKSHLFTSPAIYCIIFLAFELL
jgi:hypothetical protein